MARLRLASLLPAALAVAGLPAPVAASSASATMEVSLTVEPACGVSATPLVFAGTAGQAMDAAAEIAVACNSETPVAVRLDGGLNPDGAARRLTGVGGTVPYAIYADAARSRQWSPEASVPGLAGAVPLRLAAYGRVDAGATVRAQGTYADTITVTVDF